MKIKKLKWKDNITQFGKELHPNAIQLISSVEDLDLYYSIQNHMNMNDIKNIIYLYIKSKYIMCSSIKEAKEKAQEHFLKTVMKLYFQK